MTKEELIRNLKYTMEKHKNDKVDTFGTNISLMCKDVLDYLEQQPSDDCVSRTEAIRLAEQGQVQGFEWQIRKLITLSPVTPTHGTCKECKNWDTSWQPNSFNVHFCPMVERNTNPEYYCADYEKRGNENDI